MSSTLSASSVVPLTTSSDQRRPSLPTKAAPPAVVHFFAGALGGAAGSIVTAPFDIVKTRLQSDLFRSKPGLKSGPELARAKPHLGGGVRGLLANFTETGAILRDVYRYEGGTALFRGLGPTLAGVVPGRSINFFVYGNGKRILANKFNHGKENSLIHLSAAAVAGVITATATNPIWVIKTRMQLAQLSTIPTPSTSSSTPSSSKRLPMSSKAPLHTSVAPLFSHSFRSLSSLPASTGTLLRSPTSLATAMSIFRLEGTRGFYRGLSASLLGVTEGTIQWGLYEEFKRLARGGHDINSSQSKDGGGWKISAAAGGAKLVATMITYPHEVVRTRLRQPPKLNTPPKYVHLVQTFKLILAEEGWRALYSGLSPHLMRVIPNAVVMFFVYERIVGFESRRRAQAHLSSEQVNL